LMFISWVNWFPTKNKSGSLIVAIMIFLYIFINSDRIQSRGNELPLNLPRKQASATTFVLLRSDTAARARATVEFHCLFGWKRKPKYQYQTRSQKGKQQFCSAACSGRIYPVLPLAASLLPPRPEFTVTDTMDLKNSRRRAASVHMHVCVWKIKRLEKINHQ
jgi:hypothetical protein